MITPDAEIDRNSAQIIRSLQHSRTPSDCAPGAQVRTESFGNGYLALPDGGGPHPGVVVIHEVYGLNDNIRDICGRFAEQGYAALGVDLFAGRNRAVCMARIVAGWLIGSLEDFGVRDLRSALDQLASRPEVDAERIGAVGFCMGGMYAITWACTDDRLRAIAPYYGSTPRRQEALRRLCPVVGSWPARDFTTGARATLEVALSAAGVPRDLKLYPGTKHSFFNDRGPTYDAEAAADSWQRVSSLLCRASTRAPFRAGCERAWSGRMRTVSRRHHAQHHFGSPFLGSDTAAAPAGDQLSLRNVIRKERGSQTPSWLNAPKSATDQLQVASVCSSANVSDRVSGLRRSVCIWRGVDRVTDAGHRPAVQGGFGALVAHGTRSILTPTLIEPAEQGNAFGPQAAS